MNTSGPFDDIYNAVNEIIPFLTAAGQVRLATTLRHRMRDVPWTTGSELLEELEHVIVDSIRVNDPSLSRDLRQQLERILIVIRAH